MKATALTLAGLVIFAGIILGGWQAGWWFTTQNVNRTDVLYQQSYAAQNSAEHELSQEVTEIGKVDSQLADPVVLPPQRSALTAQRVAMLNQACETAGTITHPTVTHAAWFAQNCESSN